MVELAKHLGLGHKRVRVVLRDLGMRPRGGRLDEHQARAVMLVEFLIWGHRAMPGQASRIRRLIHDRALKRHLQRDAESRALRMEAKPFSRLPPKNA